MRASDHLDIPLGAVADFVDPKRAARYVFAGWARTNAGPEAVMVQEIPAGARLGPGGLWIYKCSMLNTLLARFPDLARYRK